MNLPGWSVPYSRAALCGCEAVFDSADLRCPKCGSETAWVLLDSDRASSLIHKLRDLLAVAEGTLKIVSKRRLGPTSTSAALVVDRIERFKKETAPGATEAAQKETNVQ